MPHSIRYAFLLSAFFMASPMALAIQPGNQLIPSHPAINTKNTIERGGVVNNIDLHNKTIVIDQISYLTNVSPIKIHLLSAQTSENISDLKSGMQIRFTSSVDKSRQETIREIWITSPVGVKPRQ
jgi:hypothetical protein